ncbi:MAG: hypothetical protein ACRDVL_03360 [Acidimicrobiia bacterium]
MSDLEHALHRAAAGIEWPDADVTGPVVGRIRAEKRPAPARRWVQVALAAAAVVLLVLATPAGREAVADLLEVAGIKVTWRETNVAPGATLDLGEQVTLAEAAEEVAFRPLVPAAVAVGEPDAVFHSDFPPGGAVHLVWESGEALLTAGDTGVGLLYSQFQLPDSGVFVKSLSPQTQARAVNVRGNDGFWIEGAPHIIFYQDENGSRTESARLAANVLAWDEGGVTHRIETTLGLEETLRLAESLEPMP